MVVPMLTREGNETSNQIDLTVFTLSGHQEVVLDEAIVVIHEPTP